MNSQTEDENDNKKALDAFGKFLIQEVRDTSISASNDVIDGRMKGESAQAIYQKLSVLSTEQVDALHSVIPFLVNISIARLLWALEETEKVNVSVDLEERSIPSIRTISDGLVGEMYGDYGWVARFSKYK